jgi:hypothetical protein
MSEVDPLIDLLDRFFQRQKRRKRLKPDFGADFNSWYASCSEAEKDHVRKLHSNYLSESEAARVCEHITTEWFSDMQSLWPTVLGHLLLVINDPLRLDDDRLQRFRETVGSYLRRNAITPWWETRSLWSILVSPGRNVVLPVSASVVRGRQGGSGAIALAGNFRADGQMEGQLNLAKDLCERRWGRPGTLWDTVYTAICFFGLDPNQREHPDEDHRFPSTRIRLCGEHAVRIPSKLSFYIALIGLLVTFLLLRLPLPRLYSDFAFLFSVVSLLGLVLSVPWDQASNWLDFLLKRPGSTRAIGVLNRTYHQVFIHDGETQAFQGPSAGLAFYWALNGGLSHKGGWWRKLREEMKHCAVSARLDHDGTLQEVGQMKDKLCAVRSHDEHCRESERKITTVILPARQWGEVIQNWYELTEEEGAAERLETKRDQTSSCDWARSGEGLTLVACPSVDAFLRFFRPAWKVRWLISRVCVVVGTLFLLYFIIQLPPTSPRLSVLINGRIIPPCPGITRALCVTAQPGRAVFITTRILSPRLLWPARWLLHWPLDLSVTSSDPMCSWVGVHRNGPLRAEIQTKIMEEILEEYTVSCSIRDPHPHNQGAAYVIIAVCDKLHRCAQQDIVFNLEEVPSQQPDK